MSKELEDVVVIDHNTRRLINFSDIVPPELREEELAENLEVLLSPNQERLGIYYFSEDEESQIKDKSVRNGGCWIENGRKGLRYLRNLPLHKM